MKDLLDRVRIAVVSRLSPTPPDPFRTLELQARLTRLVGQMDTLSGEQSARFALGHHARAINRAYDETLVEACALIGVPVALENSASRLLAEGHLIQAGWTW
ncbi:MAG TPA: hypothetical protein VEY14_00560 [Nocardioidaceae bacterium]|nr:hypothetical protein [Nocardioidaceae bacterium]